MSSSATNQQGSPRRPWLETRSLGQSILLFAGGYVVVQPVLLWLASHVAGDPLPLTTWTQWRIFLPLVAALGAVAGGVWRVATLAGNRRIGLILRSFCRMLAFSSVFAARRLADLGWGSWIVMTVITATVLALVSHPMERWEVSHHTLREAP